MNSHDLSKLIAHHAENTRFEDWNSTRELQPRFIYACEYGTFWKFTPKEWWLTVNRIVGNEGSHEFPLSKASRRPRYILKGPDGVFYSSDATMRCVNPINWTLEDWKRELLDNSNPTAGPLDVDL
jgi:hypothetical protein